jgi:hypothetical protein
MEGENNQIDFLIIDKEDFKAKIEKRLEIGNEFLIRQISTEQEKQKVWDDFIDWDDFNEELLKNSFENPNNSYLIDYKRQDNSFMPILFGVSEREYKKPSFQESIKNTKDEISWQVRKFQWFYNKIDLLRIKENIPKSNKRKIKFDLLLNLLKRFHKVANALRERRENRETLIIRDEYDVQDLLFSLLQLHFEDIRKEDPTPNHSGASSRIDFVLKIEKIVIEVKISNENLKDKQLGEQLLVDIGRYKGHPDCSDLVIFIYDKSDYVRNKKGLINDLEMQSTANLKVSVIIVPE